MEEAIQLDILLTPWHLVDAIPLVWLMDLVSAEGTQGIKVFRGALFHG